MTSEYDSMYGLAILRTKLPNENMSEIYSKYF